MPGQHRRPMATLLDSYQNPNFPGVNELRRFARRYYGVHMVRPDSSQAPATIATGCTVETDTAQIGCLVKASPCSIGFAGREAADAVAPFNEPGAPDQQRSSRPRRPSRTWRPAATPVYPLARKLWFNSFQDPIVGFAVAEPDRRRGRRCRPAWVSRPCARWTRDCPGTDRGPCNTADGPLHHGQQHHRRHGRRRTPTSSRFRPASPASSSTRRRAPAARSRNEPVTTVSLSDSAPPKGGALFFCALAVTGKYAPWSCPCTCTWSCTCSWRWSWSWS